jgi:hypothetical protein
MTPATHTAIKWAAQLPGSFPRAPVAPGARLPRATWPATWCPLHAPNAPPPPPNLCARHAPLRRVFRSRLLEASRRGAGDISFFAIAGRLSRSEAAKAFYQVCGAAGGWTLWEGGVMMPWGLGTGGRGGGA